MTNCIFFSNTAIHGAGIYITCGSSSITIINSTFLLEYKPPVILYVDGEMSSSGDGTSWDRAFKTIQEAIDNPSTGFEIWIKNGIYSIASQIDLNKDVSIYGGFNGTEGYRYERDWENNVTTVDGQGSVRCFYIGENAASLISGLTISNGRAPEEEDNDDGGAILNRGTLIIEHCSVSNNSSGYNDVYYERDYSGNGGGIFNEGILSIRNCIVNNNIIGEGGEDLGNGGGIYNSNTGELVIDNSTIGNNQAGYTDYGIFSGGAGGGIYNAGNLTINNSNVSGNALGSVFMGGLGRSGDGGGIFNEGKLEINNSDISGNYISFTEANPAGNGGGIYNVGTLVISNSDISGNYTESGGDYAGDGGGFYNRGDIIIDNSIISNNGAGEAIFPGSGGGFYNTGNLTLTSCIISHNSTGSEMLDFSNDAGHGGGFYNTGNLTLTSCIISHNSSGEAGSEGKGGDGGGFYNEGSLIIEGSIIINNPAGDCDYYWSPCTGGNGGGICNTGRLSINSCTFSKNRRGACSTNGYGNAIYNNSSSPSSIINCILWKDNYNEGSEIYNDNSSLLISYSDIEGCGGSSNWNSSCGTDGSGNIDSDPLFVDPNNDDYHLQVDSPCIDTGTSEGAMDIDLDGIKRPQDGDGLGAGSTGDGSDYDMGAYEFVL